MIVIGVDLGIAKAAAAVWHDRDGERRLIWTGAIDASNRPSRAGQLYTCASWVGWVYDDMEKSRLPGEGCHVFIEEPLIGNNRAYSMKIAQMYGAVLSALWMPDSDVGVFGVNVSTWKKQVIGTGNAGKEEVRNYITVVNSSYSDLCGHDQDRYDAAAVGLYGVLVAARADLIRPRS